MDVSPKGLEPIADMRRRSVTIVNPQGLHMRPAAAFAELASRFESRVLVQRDAQCVDGKNWLELLLLAAEAGTELVLEVAGPDAATAIDALAVQLAAPAPPESEPTPLSPKG